MNQIASRSASPSTSTKPLHNRMAMAFDFDETLAPDTLNGLLNYLDMDVEAFRDRRVQPLVNAGWDVALARAYCLVQASQQRPPGQRITADRLAEFGQSIQPYPGVEGMFDRLRDRLSQLNPDIDLEFYIITGGFGDIVRQTAIAPQFKRIWGCELAYNDQGEITFLKRSISHTEKTRYLMQIASGQAEVDGSGRAFAYRDAPASQLEVPLSQMIYVGDGASDVPCFSLVNEKGGVTIGVLKGHTVDGWEREVQVSPSQRVTNLAPADYQDDAEMMRSLVLAIEQLCKQIELRQLSVGE